MLDSEKIEFYLRLFKGIDAEHLEKVIDATQQRILEPGVIYIREGENSSRLGYIKEGMIRSYHVNEKGIETTVLLRWEEQIVASYDSILMQKPSRFTYHALEKTTLLEVEYSVIEKLLEDNPVFEKARYHFVLDMLTQSLERIESFILQTPEERYLQLIKDKPDLLQRVPDKHLATLLGITPVSLSRIRKRITQKLSH
ncbi:Crp/Fnr family transcriptional regulator [Filimonas effusa]|uniref:Crp/Fnr family transcriptional regulator n=1 Tax=Filimonas effusa TaxID=2508721 RepID=A0A4Q1DAY6_9BACT|nr:Crp/Fnr family transcriptional regulator [Filimonas effusa]RXK86577.1 Crp/Fnr family transcriptional regulator [Filimonas effusa]